MNIYFSHGFGVWSDDAGMFPDIAKILGNVRAVYASYNDKNERGEMVVSPFSEQVRRLEVLVADAKEDDLLICHSQGCIIAALATLPKFRRVIFITPPPYTSVSNFKERIAKRQGVKFPNGLWSFPSSQGATRWIPQTYLDELAATTDVVSLYTALAHSQDLVILTARDDEVLQETDVSMIPTTQKELPGIITLPGNQRRYYYAK